MASSNTNIPRQADPNVPSNSQGGLPPNNDSLLQRADQPDQTSNPVKASGGGNPGGVTAVDAALKDPRDKQGDGPSVVEKVADKLTSDK